MSKSIFATWLAGRSRTTYVSSWHRLHRLAHRTIPKLVQRPALALRLPTFTLLPHGHKSFRNEFRKGAFVLPAKSSACSVCYCFTALCTTFSIENAISDASSGWTPAAAGEHQLLHIHMDTPRGPSTADRTAPHLFESKLSLLINERAKVLIGTSGEHQLPSKGSRAWHRSSQRLSDRPHRPTEQIGRHLSITLSLESTSLQCLMTASANHSPHLGITKAACF